MMANMIYSSFLSPIDDYSNVAFRLLCQRYGADAACVPLVNSTAVSRDRSKISLVDAHIDEKNLGVQVVGNNPEELATSCKIIAEEKPFIKWFNINCGCPSVRTMDSGGGSAFLKFPDKIALAVEKIKKQVNIPVSVKIRINENFESTISICKTLEKAEVDFLIIHGRTARQGYSGQADWNFIKMLKEKLDVPLIGNGDISILDQANNYVKEGYCDSFMVARAAMRNPQFFSGKDIQTEEEKLSIFLEYIRLYKKYFGVLDLKDLKLKAMNFLSGI